MGVVVQFNYNDLVALFPAMAPVGESLLETYWSIAETMHANDGSGPIGDVKLQSKLLNMLTAHIAQLFAPRDANGNPSSTGTPSQNIAMVGRVSSASEGSVSVQTEALTAFKTAQAQWLSQTQYGSLYWAATAQFRTFNYRGPALWGPSMGYGYGAFPIRFRR